MLSIYFVDVWRLWLIMVGVPEADWVVVTDHETMVLAHAPELEKIPMAAIESGIVCRKSEFLIGAVAFKFVNLN